MWLWPLLLAQEGGRAEQRNDRCGYGDAYGIPGAGGRVGLPADGEGRSGGCAVKINRKGVGAGGQRLRAGCGQFYPSAAIPSGVIGGGKDDAIHRNGAERCIVIVDAEHRSAASGDRLVRAGEERRVGGLRGDDNARAAGGRLCGGGVGRPAGGAAAVFKGMFFRRIKRPANALATMLSVIDRHRFMAKIMRLNTGLPANIASHAVKTVHVITVSKIMLPSIQFSAANCAFLHVVHPVIGRFPSAALMCAGDRRDGGRFFVVANAALSAFGSRFGGSCFFIDDPVAVGMDGLINVGCFTVCTDFPVVGLIRCPAGKGGMVTGIKIAIRLAANLALFRFGAGGSVAGVGGFFYICVAS